MRNASTDMHARTAVPEDAEAIAAIYNEGIEDRVATFETEPRTAEDVRHWFDGNHPIVVVERAGEVIAFAATSAFRTRECYRRNAEFSVYVARASRRGGAGRIAMLTLIDKARAAGFWKLVSGVFPENTASLRMLRSVGFRPVGTYEKHAQLDGVWRDVTIVERIVAPLVIFACVHSAGRSQMAAALFNSLVGSGKARAVAAGTQPAEHVHAVVVEAMKEVGIDLSLARPQLLTSEMVENASFLRTMGCGESCPVVPPSVRREDWELEDPKNKPIEQVRQIRDEVTRRVNALLAQEGWGHRLPDSP